MDNYHNQENQNPLFQKVENNHDTVQQLVFQPLHDSDDEKVQHPKYSLTAKQWKK